MLTSVITSILDRWISVAQLLKFDIRVFNYEHQVFEESFSHITNIDDYIDEVPISVIANDGATQYCEEIVIFIRSDLEKEVLKYILENFKSKSPEYYIDYLYPIIEDGDDDDDLQYLFSHRLI